MYSEHASSLKKVINAHMNIPVNAVEKDQSKKYFYTYTQQFSSDFEIVQTNAEELATKLLALAAELNKQINEFNNQRKKTIAELDKSAKHFHSVKSTYQGSASNYAVALKEKGDLEKLISVYEDIAAEVAKVAKMKTQLKDKEKQCEKLKAAYTKHLQKVKDSSIEYFDNVLPSTLDKLYLMESDFAAQVGKQILGALALMKEKHHKDGDVMTLTDEHFGDILKCFQKDMESFAKEKGSTEPRPKELAVRDINEMVQEISTAMSNEAANAASNSSLLGSGLQGGVFNKKGQNAGQNNKRKGSKVVGSEEGGGSETAANHSHSTGRPSETSPARPSKVLVAKRVKTQGSLLRKASSIDYGQYTFDELETQFNRLQNEKDALVKILSSNAQFGGSNVKDIQSKMTDLEKNLKKVIEAMRTKDAERFNNLALSMSKDSGENIYDVDHWEDPTSTPVGGGSDRGSEKYTQAVCEYAFNAESSDELTVAEGTVLLIITPDSGSGWSLVALPDDLDKTGYVPTSYLKISN